MSEYLFAASSEDANSILLVLEEIRTLFGFNDLKTFTTVIFQPVFNNNMLIFHISNFWGKTYYVYLFQQTQRFILPYIVSKEENESSIFLESLSTILDIDKSELLINNFPYIFSHFVRHCTKSESERALLFIQVDICFLFVKLCSWKFISLFNNWLNCLYLFFITSEMDKFRTWKSSEM